MVKTIPPTSTSDSSDTLMPTTDTMRKKAEFVSKCFIYVLKILRCIKCNKSTKKNKTKHQKKHDHVLPTEGSV
jgi:hypothetical protein